MERLLVVIAGLIGFAGVATGAAADHLAGGDPAMQKLLDIASRYWLIHAAAILAVAGLLGHVQNSQARRWGLSAAILFAGGATLFGGGMLAIVVTGSHALAAIIPIGGVAMMLGWLAVILFGVKFAR